MLVLVGCECSGVVRDAFRALGHDAYSCDLKPCERDPAWHLQCDVLDVLDAGWDLAIFHPNCQYLCSSGLFRNIGNPDRYKETEKALEFVRKLMGSGIPKICIENPTGRISTAIRPYDQRIQPYEFGHDASKGTCLWLDGLKPLVIEPELYVEPRIVVVNGKEYKRWANQTDSGQNRLGPSDKRSADRARTYQGIADAFARNWGMPRVIRTELSRSA